MSSEPLNNITSRQIKAEAQALGFFACGIAKAGAVADADAQALARWTEAGLYAGMDYMARHADMRTDPRLLMPEVKSIISVALNYAPARRLPAGEPQIAAYALGRDYHDIIKRRLHALAARLGISTYRVFCDTAPVLERYWAASAGIGWVGRNRQLIIPRAGSMFFLGEMFVSFELDYDSPMRPLCGDCHACTDACPTGALSAGRCFDAGRCLSYQTIENRGPIPDGLAACLGDTFYGCDRCQDACPWNRFATPTADADLQPSEELLRMTRQDWLTLTVEQYRRLFKGSAVKRAKFDGLKRNIALMASAGTSHGPSDGDGQQP